jgi:flavin reductase (DIM6/NTAB) family NADH-FMN oxidoreductase RutF
MEDAPPPSISGVSTTALAEPCYLRGGFIVMDKNIASPGNSQMDETDFKMALRQIASSVAVITTLSDGKHDGLTATAVCSVSATPPMMLACINLETPVGKLISASSVFAINFLTEEQHMIARLFSTQRSTPEQRFAEGRWSSLVTGAPILENAAASFDCKVENRVETGAHNIYFGRVEAVTSLNQEILLYRDGSFRRLVPID